VHAPSKVFEGGDLSFQIMNVAAAHGVSAAKLRDLHGRVTLGFALRYALPARKVKAGQLVACQEQRRVVK
jgi:hypothetical protein